MMPTVENCCLLLRLLWVSLFLFVITSVRAGETATDSVEMEWDGHVKVSARAVFPGSGTAFDAVGLEPNYDGSLELRLNNKAFFSESIYTEIHWEGLLGGGGTRRDGRALSRLYPEWFPAGLFNPIQDDRRLFDFTTAIHTDRNTIAFHRLDRAMVSLSPEWGEIRLGRQAVTWGHGFTFNAMDLFNPFAPTDLERDYKMGDDMALIQFPLRDMNVELIYVVRRNPDTQQTGFDRNSIGAKINLATGGVEMDVMITRHYKDYVAGIGTVGYLGDAAWRFDVTGTFLNRSSRGRSFYTSAVVNIDYSWTWLGKNVYGFLEVYYNGLSDDDYTDHYTDSTISERLARGELFTLGALYGSGNINVELHPLLNFYLTPIVNLNDGSGVLLPRLVYDMADNLRLNMTGALNWGKSGSEYGGYDVPGESFDHEPSDIVSVWLTWYY